MPEEVFTTSRGSINRSELLLISKILKSHHDILASRPLGNKKVMNEAADLSEKIKGLF